MARNDFVPFATGATANVQDLVAYTDDPMTDTGHISGIASSARANRSWRQGTFVASAIAEIAQRYSGLDSEDNGNREEFISHFLLGLQNFIFETIGKVTAGPTTNLRMMVETTGNDSTADGSTTSPFRTIYAAYYYLQSHFNCNGYLPVIDVGGGTYSTGGSLGGGGAVFSGPIVGQNQAFLLTTHGGAVTINGIGVGFFCVSGASMQLQGTWILNCAHYTPGGAGDDTLLAEVSGTVILLPADQLTLTLGQGYACHMQAAAGGLVAVQGGAFVGGVGHPGAYTITGGAQFHQYASASGTIIAGVVNVTIQNNPNFNVFMGASEVGIVYAGGYTFTGPATGLTYSVNNNGVIYAGGQGEGYLPGSIRPGSRSTGGQYN